MMHMHLSMLITDWIIWALFFLAVTWVIYIRKLPHLSGPLRQVLCNRLGMIAAVILGFYVVVGLLDSVHFEVRKQTTVMEVKSLLDIMLSSIADRDEQTYSAPLATHLYTQSVVLSSEGKEQRVYPHLRYAGKKIKNSEEKNQDIIYRVILGFSESAVVLLIFYGFFLWILSRRYAVRYWKMFNMIIRGETELAWMAMLVTFGLCCLYIFVILNLELNYYVFGTSKIGHDVFYESIKSIRTGLIIGVLTTIFMLPFALILGMFAGFFGGWVDDIIQYLYTSLSSIPGVLLISAAVLVMQVYISAHPQFFDGPLESADARLLALCIILSITSWANICRLLRAESLKLRELEFVQAATVLGVSKVRIVFRHIMPNVMHIVLITLVLDFSTLVLAEAVLSYVGVGVDPSTYSWGNMINSSRLELAREPTVWWPLFSALFYMFILVLSANLFADAVRDALDPRIRKRSH